MEKINKFKRIDYSLTPQDVANIVNDDIKVILSSDFGKIKNINELIDPKKLVDKILILFRKEHKTINAGNQFKTLVNGHYCALMKLGNKLCFYDPYGTFPTDQLKHIKPEYRAQTDQVKNYLADLMLNSPYELHYSPHKHQQCKLGINTCGRHCGVFLKLELEPEEYNNIIRMNTKGKFIDDKILKLSNKFMEMNKGNNIKMINGGNEYYSDSSSDDDEYY